MNTILRSYQKQDFLPQQNTAALHLKTELMCSERRNLF